MKLHIFKTILILFSYSFVSSSYSFAEEPSIDMYIGSWKNSFPVATHGTMVERPILTKGDPLNPAKPGACLSLCSRFSRGILEGHVVTEPVRLSNEQEILYIIRGTGRIKAGTKYMDISEGNAALIPPDIEFTIENLSSDPMDLLVLVEPFPEGKIPRKDILVRNANTQPVHAGGHWAHIVRGLFGENDGLGILHSVIIVSIDGMNIGEPHSHVAGTEEVWYQLKGTSIAYLGKEIRNQEPGTAYMVPPDNKTVHSNINPGDEPMVWFYFAHYGQRP